MSGALQHAAGFDGAVSGMSLADLLQIKALGRFSGRIVVEQNGKEGHLFFRDGDLFHAQLDDLEGREAFARIMSWGGGTFRAEPKVTTTRQTLHENFQFLLLDVLRLQDEASSEILMSAGQAVQADSRKEIGMKERLSGIAGLQDVALTDRKGTMLQQIGDNAESLAAQGMYLVSTAGQISDELGLGAFKGASVQGVSSHLITLEGPRNFLFFSVAGDAKPASVEQDVRRAIAQ